MKLGNIFSQDRPALMEKENEETLSTYGNVISIVFSKSIDIAGIANWIAMAFETSFFLSRTFLKLYDYSSLLNFGSFEMYHIVRIYEERTRHCRIFTKHWSAACLKPCFFFFFFQWFEDRRQMKSQCRKMKWKIQEDTPTWRGVIEQFKVLHSNLTIIRHKFQRIFVFLLKNAINAVVVTL